MTVNNPLRGPQGVQGEPGPGFALGAWSVPSAALEPETAQRPSEENATLAMLTISTKAAAGDTVEIHCGGVLVAKVTLAEGESVSVTLGVKANFAWEWKSVEAKETTVTATYALMT